RPGLETALRITLPGEPAAFERLTTALDTVLAPQAIIFDLDGVLADVRESQRAAMIATATAFGVTITMGDIETALRAGDAARDAVDATMLALGDGERGNVLAATDTDINDDRGSGMIVNAAELESRQLLILAPRQ